MREKFSRFMQGRYGVDAFARFTIGVALACMVLAAVGAILGWGYRWMSLLDTLGLLLIIYTYFRIFSRNIQRRYGENQKYQAVMAKLRRRFNREKDLMEQRKTHHIYTCPQCRQKIRIPKGKGKIEIECPRCHTKFVKRS